MRRKAILIEASKVTGLTDLPGARKDVEEFKTFLQSPIGGAWENEEITTLHTPTLTALTLELAIAKYSDYVFIAFSGHGQHVKGKEIDETRVFVSGQKEVPLSTFNCGADRTTIVIDACREVSFLEEAREFSAAMLAKEGEFLDPKLHREKFDASVRIAPKGIEILFSCDIEEVAHETKRGGYFSQGLIRSAKGLKPGTTLDIEDAFKSAYKYVQNEVPQQHPQFNGGRRLTHFPFAVRV